MGYLSTLLSSSRITTLLSKLVTWTILLFRKKIFLAFAFYWTFSNSIQAVFNLLSGGQTLAQVGRIVVEEAYRKFLGAGPNILQGLRALNSGDLVGALFGLWTGVASIYLLLFLYRKLFEFKGIREVEWPEKVLVFAVIILLTSQVHGVNLLLSIVDQLQVLFDSVSGILPTQEGSSFNSSVNKTNSSIL